MDEPVAKSVHEAAGPCLMLSYLTKLDINLSDVTGRAGLEH